MIEQTLPQLPENLEKYVGVIRGIPAPGKQVPVNIPLHEAQRPISRSALFAHIDKVKGFDWNLFGYITVVYNPKTDTYKVLDGQHRLAKARLLTDVKDVPALVIETDDPIYESKLFAYYNGLATKNLTREELYKAEVLAMDSKALYFKDVIESANLSIGEINAGPKNTAVKYANFEKCMRMGEEETKAAAAYMRIAMGFPQKIHDQVFSGLTKLLQLYPELMSNRNIATQFKDWFTDKLPMAGQTMADLKYEDYRRGQWHDGIAYGLAQDFNKAQARNGGMKLAIHKAKNNWLKSTDSDSSEEEVV